MAPSSTTDTEAKTHPGIRVTTTKDRLSAMVVIKAPDESEPDPTPEEFYVPHQRLGTGLAYWMFLVLRIGGASTVVSIIEELFWRAFVLRLLIDWHRFEDVPLARFTWFSFIGCSLHLGSWEVAGTGIALFSGSVNFWRAWCHQRQVE